jgi:glutamine synthetase adenylyltransferase
VRRVRQRLKKGSAAKDNRAEIAKLEREVASLVDAIASGALRSSPALAQRLQATEAALDQLRTQPPAPDVERLLPQLADRCRAAINGLERTLGADLQRARTEVAEHVGSIQVVATSTEIRLETQKGRLEAALLALTGGRYPSSLCGSGGRI